MWQILLQLRVLLPYLSRLLPLLEGTLARSGTARSAINIDTSHFEQSLSVIESAHRDLGLQVQTQTSQIKHMQEQLTWLSTAVERDALKNDEIAIAVQTLARSLRIMLVVTSLLLLILIGMVAYLLAALHG